MNLRWAGAVLALAGACLPIKQRIKHNDAILGSSTHQRSDTSTELRAKVDTSDIALTVALESVVSCTEEQRHKVRRSRTLEKRTNLWVHGATYLLSIGVIGLGGTILYDNIAVEAPEDRQFPIGSTLSDGRTVGTGIAVLGGVILLIALGSSAQAVDDQYPAVVVDKPIAGTQRRAECKRGPGIDQHVGLVFATAGGSHSYVPVGRTDARGKISVSWSTIQGQVAADAAPEASVVVGAPDAIEAALRKQEPLTLLAKLKTPLAANPEQAWASAMTTDTESAYRAFVERFPDSPHVAEAIERGKQAPQRRFDAAIAEGNVDKATEALAVLKGSADATALAQGEQQLERLRRTATIKDAQKKLPELLSKLETASDLRACIDAIEAIRAADPEAASRADRELETARDRVAARLVEAGKDAALKRDFAAAATRFTAAGEVARDRKSIERARAAAFADAVKAAHAEAQTLARAKDYTQAISLATAVLDAVPTANKLAADRKRWQDAVARNEKAEAARAARQASVEEAKAKHEAELAARDAAANEAKAKREADRAARDAAANEAKAKREADRAARETTAKEAKAKRDAELAARDAAAKEAKANREAATKQAAENDRKQREEEAQARAKAAEAARIEAARKQEAKQAAKAGGKPQSPSFSVQFELAARFAGIPVLNALPVPKSCTVANKSFFAIPARCPDCAPRSMSQADLTCGPLKFTFTRDLRDVWFTCTGAGQTCASCLAAGQSALAAFGKGRDTLKVVLGCPAQ